MKKKLACVTLIILFAMFSLRSIAQTTQENGNPVREQSPSSTQRESSATINNPFWNSEETPFKIGMRYTLLLGTPVITLLFGINAWDWGENHDWKWGHERWFQSDTDSGGADKIGHCYALYVVTRVAYSLFSYTEPNYERAVQFSGFTGALVGFIIEFGDAFTGRYGFSCEDLISDLIGVGIAVILDSHPALDAFIGFTAHYWPSEGFRRDKNKTVLNFAGDYTGWKYMFNFKFGGFHYLGFRLPEFLRFVQLDIGYYTRNYTDYDELIGRTDARRYWFFGISINMREVARDAFFFHGKISWLAQQPFKYYHVPIGYESAHAL
ncbi:MAG: YfiM family protein [Spirochaetes bacterium]|nr:YfiM family protein [Spirochaetota bacterium]